MVKLVKLKKVGRKIEILHLFLHELYENLIALFFSKVIEDLCFNQFLQIFCCHHLKALACSLPHNIHHVRWILMRRILRILPLSHRIVLIGLLKRNINLLRLGLQVKHSFDGLSIKIMLLPDVRVNTKQKLFLDFPDFSHGTHVELCIFVQVPRYNDDFEFHGFWEEVRDGNGVKGWLICLKKRNFNVFFLNYFRWVVINNDCWIYLKLCCCCHLYASIGEPFKLINIKGCDKYVNCVITTTAGFREIQPCERSKHKCQPNPLVFMNLWMVVEEYIEIGHITHSWLYPIRLWEGWNEVQVLNRFFIGRMNPKNLRDQGNRSIFYFKLHTFGKSFRLSFDGKSCLTRGCIRQGIKSKVYYNKVIALQVIVEGVICLSRCDFIVWERAINTHTAVETKFPDQIVLDLNLKFLWHRIPISDYNLLELWLIVSEIAIVNNRHFWTFLLDIVVVALQRMVIDDNLNRYVEVTIEFQRN